MPKVLILVLISNQDVFLNNFKELRSHYTRMGVLYNIPVSVVGYMGGSDTTFHDTETGILHLNCPDNDLGVKLLRAAEYIKSNMEYDFIIKTNASTLVNLQLMYRIMTDPRTDWWKIYHKSYIMDIEICRSEDDKFTLYSYPCGTYAMCSSNIFNRLFDDGAEAVVNELIDYYINSLGSNIYAESEWGWTGLSEDSVFGWLAHIRAIPFYSLYEDLAVSDNYRESEIHRISSAPMEKIPVTPSIICKVADWSDNTMRNNIEPPIIHACGLLFETGTLTDNDYEEFYRVNMVENVNNGKCNTANQCLYIWQQK